MDIFQSYSILDSLLDASAVIGIDGQLYYCNEALSNLCGLPLRQMRRKKHISEVFKINDIHILEDKSLQKLESSTLYEEVSLLSTTNKAARIQISAQPILNESGEKKILLFLHDLTLEEKLQNKYRFELSQKDKHISDISLLLEISTALTGIRNTQTVMKIVANKLLARNICKIMCHFKLAGGKDTIQLKMFKSVDQECDLVDFSSKSIMIFGDLWKSQKVQIIKWLDHPALFSLLAAKVNIGSHTRAIFIPVHISGKPDEVVLLFEEGGHQRQRVLPEPGGLGGVDGEIPQTDSCSSAVDPGVERRLLAGLRTVHDRHAGPRDRPEGVHPHPGHRP